MSLPNAYVEPNALGDGIEANDLNKDGAPMNVISGLIRGVRACVCALSPTHPPPLPSFPSDEGKRRRWPSANQEVDAQHRLWIHWCPNLAPPAPEL